MQPADTFPQWRFEYHRMGSPYHGPYKTTRRAAFFATVEQARLLHLVLHSATRFSAGIGLGLRLRPRLPPIVRNAVVPSSPRTHLPRPARQQHRDAGEGRQVPRILQGRPHQRPHEDHRSRPRCSARLGSESGGRLRIQAQVPVRQDQHAAQARTGRFRGHRNGLLCCLGQLRDPRRNRPRVPGQHIGQSLHPPDEHLRQWRRQPRAATLPLVRPHRKLPHVFLPVEPEADCVSAHRSTDRSPKASSFFFPFYVPLFTVLNPLARLCACRFYVDSTPIRVFANRQDRGIPFPTKQPMGVYSSIWNADDWATQGGRVKTDWSHAPFVASYQDFDLDACPIDSGKCGPNSGKWWDAAAYTSLSPGEMAKLRQVNQKYLIYDYCTDKARFPQKPAECP